MSPPSPPAPPVSPPASSFAPAKRRSEVGFLHAAYEVARKDVLQHIRTKRVFIIGLLLFATLLLVTLILPVMAFGEGDSPPDAGEPARENFAFFIYMNASVFGGNFMIQLLAIVLTADAVCSEWQSRTLFLLLSKPVSRAAFVVGKYAGALATVLPTFLILFTLQYALVQPFYEGSPSGEEVGRFFGAMGTLALGASAIAAVALFFSTLTKSNVQSLVLTLLTVFLVLPLLGNIGDFVFFGDSDGDFEPDRTGWKYDWSHYLSPDRTISVAGDVLLDGQEGESFALSFVIPQFPPQRIGLSLAAGAGFAMLFLAASVAIVRRRNFE
ncbi:MAG TPA: ABC transporter permease [Candidatus Thermoplasmatota archaeon]|nr:ABC transporter permease [Candidatus Thermoplasmatota archaeon]